MKLLKGIVQLKMQNEHVSNYEKGNFFTYKESETDMLDVILRNGGTTPTGWNNNDLVGRDHPAFSNFILWFEY